MRTVNRSPNLPTTAPTRSTNALDDVKTTTSSSTTAATTATGTTNAKPALLEQQAAEPHTCVVGEPQASTTQTTRGRPATVDVRDPIAAHRAQLKADLKVAMSTLSTLPPALTFFGGARIKSSDPYYAISMEIGRLLAERGVPPRTGAGPGIMQSVPEGYVQHRAVLEASGTKVAPSAQLRQIDGLGDTASLDDVRTQGFNIKLPHEQKLNPVIEVAREIQLFPFRKLALYENARGVVTFPGGFGTLDELFEIWTLAASDRLSDPLAAVGVDFWKPTLEALKDVAVDARPLIAPHDFERLFVTDDATALLDHMLTSSSAPKGFEQPAAALEKTLLKEVDVAARGMKTLRPAVAFLGGETLRHDDTTLAIAAAVASAIAAGGAAVRVGDGGVGSQAVVDAARAAGAGGNDVQQIAWTASTVPAAPSSTPSKPSTSTKNAKQEPPSTTTFSERIPHKELLLRSAEAYVVLPSGLKGLDEFATVLCQMQTGKLPKRPLVLVGSDYWQPILDAFKQTMLTPERMLIAPEDLQLVTIVDSAEAATAALTNLR